MIDLTRWRNFALRAGIAGLVLTAIGLFFSPVQFFRSYLWAFLFWFGIALGCLPLLMLYHLVGGAWGFTIRRIVESGTRTLPLLAVLFVPVLIGIPQLYEWSHAEKVAQVESLRQKQAYLNVPFWILRSIFYFAVWLFYAYRLNRMSVIQDETGEPRLVNAFERLSGPGLVAYGLTITFAAFDWAMSLEPQWYSTIYGMLWIVSQALSSLAFAIAMVALLSDRAPMSHVSVPDSLQDLGNLLLAFVMLWAYLSFAQFLIIWSGNLPEEIAWYLNRMRHGWQWVAAALITFHFFVPFILLLSRFRKRRVQWIATIAALVLFMRVVDTYWIVTPAFYGDHLTIHWLDIFALVGIGGVWLGFYARQLTTMPLLPLHDPNATPHKAI
jgi:hypothetical protein